MLASLRIVRAGGQVESLKVHPRTLLVGREAGDIVLRDPQASARHLELTWDGRSLTFRDLGSTNGTFVNGARFAEKMLQPGEAITIGSSRIEFVGPVGQPAAGPAGTMVAMPSAVSPSPSPVVKVAAAKASPSPGPASPIKKTSAGRSVAIVAGCFLVACVLWAAMAVNRFGGAGATISNGEATVNAVWFAQGPDGVKGGTSPVTVRVTANKTPGVSVGVLEEFAGGTGSQWRTATWLAAFNASQAAGITLADHEYLVRVGGHIDGPSAGMLITSTMLGILQGDRIHKTTTMTGTINPDGSAGPVGGIVQKMRGAKASGMTRFGYPIGARNHVDMATGKTVDLEELARELGLEAREIPDLATAYEFVTGRALEQAAPVDERAMELDPETTQRLRAKLSAWRARVNKEITTLKELSRTRRLASFQDTIDSATASLNDADKFERSDLPAAALQEYVAALISLRGTAVGLGLVESLQRRDFQNLEAQVQGARATSQRIASFGDELKIAANRGTVGGHVNLTSAMVAYVQAESLGRFADANHESALRLIQDVNAGRTRPTNEVLATVGVRLMVPVLAYLGADVLLDHARDQLDLAGDEGGASPANLDAYQRQVGGYASAAGATLAYFEALEVEPLTRRGTSLDDARERVAQLEFGYRIARAEIGLAEHLTGQDQATQMQRLAAGIDAFLTSASLVNKYYALGGRTDGGDFSLTNRKALTAQLDLARTNARRAAALSQQQAGFIPRAARFAYQRAGAAREGSDAEKIGALTAYWEAAQWSNLAARLSR